MKETNNKRKEEILASAVRSFPIYEVQQICFESRRYPRRRIRLQRVGLFQTKESAEDAMHAYIKHEKECCETWDEDYYADSLGYYIDEVFYSYPQGKTHIRQHRMNAHGEHFRQENTYSDCVYDMLSIFMRSRSFNPEGWKKGHVVKIPIVDGDSRINAQLRYSGTTVVKADDGHRYRCLQLSYMEPDKGKMKEIVRFYVTDDDNHIPVRLDMFLRFGSAKAFLSSMKGTRSQIKAMVK
jgi:hypothetical protein